MLIRLGAAIDPDLLAEVVALDAALTARKVPGLLRTIPAYASLLCVFDPLMLEPAQLESAIWEAKENLEILPLTGDLVEVPTRYDGEDLASVAEFTSLRVEEVVELHTARDYLVYCVGFAPGFTYCGELDAQLVVPRKSSPRTSVPAGSVAIAEQQTGIYAVASPGGWNLIGRTEMVLFDPSTHPPARFRFGDRLRFVPIG